MVKEKLAEQRGQRDEIAAALADGSLPSCRPVRRRHRRWKEDHQELESQGAQSHHPRHPYRPDPARADVASGWALATLEARREVCRMVFAPGHAGTLLLGKRGSGKLKRGDPG